MDHEWYRTFFQGLAVDLWRQAATPEMTREEVDFLVQSLALRPGSRVLDVPCGHGRHSIELALRGCTVTGVDLSEEELAEARRRAAASGVAVEWRHADMRDLPWEDAFDAACCLGNSFGYIEPAGTRAFVRALGRTLKPGAGLVLCTGIAAECVLPHLKSHEWRPIGDILFLEENRYHAKESCIETAYTFIRDGVVRTQMGWQWVYTVRELAELLAEAGMKVRELYGSPQREPFLVGSGCLWIVAEKLPR